MLTRNQLFALHDHDSVLYTLWGEPYAITEVFQDIIILVPMSQNLDADDITISTDMFCQEAEFLDYFSVNDVLVDARYVAWQKCEEEPGLEHWVNEYQADLPFEEVQQPVKLIMRDGTIKFDKWSPRLL